MGFQLPRHGDRIRVRVNDEATGDVIEDDATILSCPLPNYYLRWRVRLDASGLECDVTRDQLVKVISIAPPSEAC